MLNKINRINTANDFRHTLRKGKRMGTTHTVISVAKTEAEAPSRFGFVVSKAIGNAVARKHVTRLLREIARERLAVTPKGFDIVIRPLEGSSELTFAELRAEILHRL
jgi:ribonuclease P protein component